MLGTLKLIEVVGHVFAAPVYAYIRETGALERKVLSWIRRFKSHNLTMPSLRPEAKNSLFLLNLIPPLTGICLL